MKKKNYSKGKEKKIKTEKGRKDDEEANTEKLTYTAKRINELNIIKKNQRIITRRGISGSIVGGRGIREEEENTLEVKTKHQENPYS